VDPFFDIKPHAEAVALIANKPAITRQVFDGLLPELRARAFTIAGVAAADVLQRVQDEIAGLAAGGEGNTWDQAKQRIVDDLEPHLGGEGADRRATLLLRTHGFQAFQSANWRVAQEDTDTTHLQYLATEDDHVRSSHLALNGLILPKNDPFWNDHLPPWEWGCRCRVRPINPDLVEMERQADRNRDPDNRLVAEGPIAQRLRDGQLIRNGQAYDVTSPRNKPGGDKAFQWHPDNLKLSAQQLAGRYDPEVWRVFELWARRTSIRPGLTVWGWIT